MMGEACESLPLSAPAHEEDAGGGGGGDDEAGGERAASPLLRRPTTGMGIYCEDGRVEGVQSSEVELMEEDVKEVSFGGDQVKGEYNGVCGAVGESNDLDELEEGKRVVGLPIMCSTGCEAKHEAETVGELTEQRSSSIVQEEAETGCPGFPGVEKESQHLQLKLAAEGGVSEKEFDIGSGEGKLRVKKPVEEWQGFLGAIDVHYRLEQPIEGGIPEQLESIQVQPASADGDTADQSFVVEVTDNGVSFNGVGDLLSEKRADVDECLEYLRSEEASRVLGSEGETGQSFKQIPVVEEEQDEFPGLSPLRTLGGDGFGRPMFDIESEVGILSSGAFDGDRFRHGCMDAEVPVSSGLSPGCSMTKINKDGHKTSEKHYFPHHHRSQKEHCGDNISSPYSICSQDISTGGEVDRCQQGSSEDDLCPSAAKGLALEESPHLSNPTDNLLLKGFQGSEVDTSLAVSACCSNAHSSCGEAGNGGRSDSKSGPTIVLRRSNPKRGASIRSNLADGNLSQLRPTRNTRRNSRKPVDISPDFLLRGIKISDNLKKKRSWPHRPAHPYAWRPLAGLLKFSVQNGQLPKSEADKVDRHDTWSNKGRSTVVSRKQPKSQKVGKPGKSSSIRYDSTSDRPISSFIARLPTFDEQIGSGKFYKGEAEHEAAANKFAVFKPLKRDMQIGDKDIESSLTQEASVDLGECQGISSQITPEMAAEVFSNRNSLDPGTSPDSDVYHPVSDVGAIATEGNYSADQVIGVKNVDVLTSECATSSQQIIISEGNLHSAISVSPKAHGIPPVSLIDSNLCTKDEVEIMIGQVGQKPPLENLSVLEKLDSAENVNESKKPSKSSKSKWRQGYENNNRNRVRIKSNMKTAKKGSKCKGFPPDPSAPETAELKLLEESTREQYILDQYVSSSQNINDSLETFSGRTDKSKGHKLHDGAKPGRSNGRSHGSKAAGRRQQVGQNKQKSFQNSDHRHSTAERSQTHDSSMLASDYVNAAFSSGIASTTTAISFQESYSRDGPLDVSSSVATPSGEQNASIDPNTCLEQPLPPQVAWVLCDDCEKWRCISVELANTLEETKCKWTCKDNIDKAFADCSIPQEKTNAEINAELGISDEEDNSSVKPSAPGFEPSKLADAVPSRRSSWTLIKANLFLHRNRKNQTIDEIMVCHCKPPRDGRLGCGDECLNRMLNIECVKGTCPCGDLCSNQRFQKRKYVKFKWLRFGKKGYGLQLQQDVSQGQFLIEYVGEVLDLATYDARQKDYAAKGQKHFYFMTLNGGEVIDACEKGNLGRFINHSCEPNCRTEKWMVNGEVCIGLFAVRDIKKGEEVTFDYNYVRVVGAAAKKCICGSSACRGYIGGDPLNSEIIVQGDSDEEDIEPVVTLAHSKKETTLSSCASRDAKLVTQKEISVDKNNIVVTSGPSNSVPGVSVQVWEDENNIVARPPLVTMPEVSVQAEDDASRSMPEVNQLDVLGPIQLESVIPRPLPGIKPIEYSQQISSSAQVKEHVCKGVSDVPQQEFSIANASFSSVPNSTKSINDLSEEKPITAKSHSRTKLSRPRGAIKRDRSTMKNPVSNRTKSLTQGSSSIHFGSVEETLNELLDANGGISKQKDATRGYLKLLCVTAAAGDVGGCGSQSTRHLSLILDAILKTNSRKVLVDIINKNGLQMLHNITKQNRGNFNRTPIIRKLLKVFEFLALARILTPELINKAPPCAGVESFKESIFKLTNHTDKLVHRTAREFRDKWIPRNIRRFEPSDRDGGQLEHQHFRRLPPPTLEYRQVHVARDSDAIVISGPDRLPASPNELAMPAETSLNNQQLLVSAPLGDSHLCNVSQRRKRKSRWDQPSDISCMDTPSLQPSNNQIPEPASKAIKCKLEPSDHTQPGAVRERNNVSGQVGSSEDPMQLDDDRPPGFTDDAGPPGFTDDVPPPGFETTKNNPIVQSPPKTAPVTSEVVVGQPQKIFLSDMTMSYGIPAALMQQLGTPGTGDSSCNQNWAVAPGMPFYPFPPLPSYPRGQPHSREERRMIRPFSSRGSGHGNSDFNRRDRWPDNGCGKRFLGPQQWDNQRFKRSGPRLPYQKFSRDYNGRDGPSNFVSGNSRRDSRGGLFHPGVANGNSHFHQPHN